MKGAGGTDGGIERFPIGLIVIIAGGLLCLNSTHVHDHFSRDHSFHLHGFHLTTGMLIIPFLFVVGKIYFNTTNNLVKRCSDYDPIWHYFVHSLPLQTHDSCCSANHYGSLISALLTGKTGLLVNAPQTLRKTGILPGNEEKKEDR